MMAERLTRQQRQHKEKVEEKLTSLPPFIDEYKDDMYTGNTSPSTLLGYIHDFETFFRWLMREGIVDVEHIKDVSLSALEHLRLVETNAFFTHLSMERELQEESINRKKSSLKSLYKFLTTRTEDEDGECYFYRNVMAKVKMAKTSETLSSRAERISNKILTGEDIEAFVTFVGEGYEEIVQGQKQRLAYYKRDKERDQAIIALLLASGLRVSELANLRLSSINLKRRKLSVLRKGNKESIVFFRSFAVPYLQAYLEVREEKYKVQDKEPYLFLSVYRGTANPMSVRAIQHTVMKYTKAYRDEQLSPHKMRHSFATEFAKRNTMYDLMRQLGHTSTDTSTLYVNAQEQEAQNSIDRMDD
ncbi:tyrosine recombinase XerS [Salimicrobium jeotgali]|nr:tyrosine recombinase XerS [Salimicrobium jeotgali]